MNFDFGEDIGGPTLRSLFVLRRQISCDLEVASYFPTRKRIHTAGPCFQGMSDSSFYRFRSRPTGEELTRTLAEGRRLLEAVGHRPVRGRFFWDAEGRQRSFPRVSDCAEPTEGVGTEVSHDETAQVETPDSPDTLWVLGDPLDDDFGQTVEASSDLHAIGDRRLSRGGSFVRLLSENSAVGFWKSWVHRIVEGRPFPDKRLFGTEGSGRVDSDNPADKT